MLERPRHTERLTLRPATADDAEATWDYRQLESVNEWLNGCPADLDVYGKLFSEPAAAREHRDHHSRPRRRGPDHRRPHGPPRGRLGPVRCRRTAHNALAEVGWVLDPAYTGHGYAIEAVRELLRYCFLDLGVRRVTANCFLDDDISWGLMERVGMRRERHAVRESLHRSGRWLDTVGYAILDEEWRRCSTRGSGGVKCLLARRLSAKYPRTSVSPSPRSQVQDVVAGIDDVRIVRGDHHHGPGTSALDQQRDDQLAVLGVELRGRLVGEEDVGGGDEGAGYGHPLLLAAREILDEVVGDGGQPHALEHGLNTRVHLSAWHSGCLQHDRDVLARGQRGHQAVALQNEPEPAAQGDVAARGHRRARRA